MICRSSLFAAARGCGAFFSLSVLGGCWLSALEKEPVDTRDCATRSAFYRDGDGDGVGDELDVVLGCAAPDGYVDIAGDCDDQDASRSAGCGDTGADTGTDTGADTAPASPEPPK
jgi:hypothetical protein